MITISSNFLTAEISPWGAALAKLYCLDRYGNWANVVLDYESESARQLGSHYLGEVVGPLANRTESAMATRDGVSVAMIANEGTTALHGGTQGCSKFCWDIETVSESAVTLALDWHQPNYPGPIRLTTTYQVVDDTLTIALKASSAQPTMVNLAPHPYFNLSGDFNSTIDEHLLQLGNLKHPATHYLPVDSHNIPLPDAPSPVIDRFDFTELKNIDTPIDHAFICDELTLIDPRSGRKLELTTNQPSIQVYTGDYLAPIYPTRSGIALEPQNYPNAAKRLDFPSPILLPGKDYENISTWRFSQQAE